MSRVEVYRPGHVGAVSPFTTGVCLGVAHTGQQIWGSIEDTYSVVGPPRSSKTARLIAPAVAMWEGPVLVTGLRPEILGWTKDYRRNGRLLVFDPGDTLDLPEGCERLRWSPLVGCTDEMIARQRAKSLFAARPAEAVGSDEAYWRAEGQKVLTSYLLAAAHANTTIMDIVAWAERDTDLEAVTILRSHGLSLWADSLEGSIRQNPKYKSGVWGQVKAAMEPFLLPSVRAATVCTTEESFSADWFLDGWHTLYLLGSPEEQEAVAGVCAALTADVIATARRRARKYGRLSMPLLLALDEAANVAPIQNMAQVLSTCGGSGICAIVVVQSVSQARTAWGPAIGEAILRDLCTQRIVLGGLGSADDLKDISSLLGEHDEMVRSVSSRGGRGMMAAHDISMSTRLRPVLSESQIRELRSQRLGEALLIPRSGKAAVVRLPAIWDMTPPPRRRVES